MSATLTDAWLALPEKTRQGLMFLKVLEHLESAPDPLYALASARAALEVLPSREEWGELTGAEDGYDELVETLHTIAAQPRPLARVLAFPRPGGSKG